MASGVRPTRPTRRGGRRRGGSSIRHRRDRVCFRQRASAGLTLRGAEGLEGYDPADRPRARPVEFSHEVRTDAVRARGVGGVPGGLHADPGAAGVREQRRVRRVLALRQRHLRGHRGLWRGRPGRGLGPRAAGRLPEPRRRARHGTHLADVRRRSHAPGPQPAAGSGDGGQEVDLPHHRPGGFARHRRRRDRLLRLRGRQRSTRSMARAAPRGGSSKPGPAVAAMPAIGATAPSTSAAGDSHLLRSRRPVRRQALVLSADGAISASAALGRGRHGLLRDPGQGLHRARGQTGQKKWSFTGDTTMFRSSPAVGRTARCTSAARLQRVRVSTEDRHDEVDLLPRPALLSAPRPRSRSTAPSTSAAATPAQ
jgi:hypothetical protein